MTDMTATLPTEYISNGKNMGHEKETTDAWIVIGIGKSRSDVVEIANARCYMGRSKSSSVVYASIWVHNKCAGHGNAGGYGYHKASAAMQAAIHSAGIKISEPIDGRGDSAIESALHAIGIAAGFDTVRVFRA